MKRAHRQRRKGGGRKFADGLFSKTRFTRKARRHFLFQSSVKRFLVETGISRQSYYRFLNRNPLLKIEITKSRREHFEMRMRNREEMRIFFKENPNASYPDFLFRNLDTSLAELANKNVII